MTALSGAVFVCRKEKVIVENLGLMGVPIPKPLINAIEVLKAKAKDDEKQIDTEKPSENLNE